MIILNGEAGLMDLMAYCPYCLVFFRIKASQNGGKTQQAKAFAESETVNFSCLESIQFTFAASAIYFLFLFTAQKKTVDNHWLMNCMKIAGCLKISV